MIVFLEIKKGKDI